MSFAVKKILLLLLSLGLLAGCDRVSRVFEDNGTHLAYALEKGAKELRRSSATELLVRYETLDATDVPYYVEFTPSIHESGQRPEIMSSYLVVSGKISGGTSYHNRFIFVPQRFHVRKDKGGPTELVLRKDGDRISVVAVR